MIRKSGQVCFFLTWLIVRLIPVQQSRFWVFFAGTSLFFTGFKVEIYWGMIKISKWMEMLKSWRIKYQGDCWQLLSTISLWVQKILSPPAWNKFFKINVSEACKAFKKFGIYNNNMTLNQKRISTYCEKYKEKRFYIHWILQWSHSIKKKIKKPINKGSLFATLIEKPMLFFRSWWRK